METFIFVMFEEEERESEIFVVRVCALLSGFCWVDRGRFLAHTHCQDKHGRGEAKISARATQSLKTNTTRGIKSGIIVVVVLMNNRCLESS